MDGGAWWAAIHGVAEGQTRLRDFTFTFHFHALEKETAPHPSTPAWRIPGTGEPGGLLSMGSHRVRHDWSDLAAAADSILKIRDITSSTKVHLVKVMVFPVVMYGCESWTTKKAERQRIDAFELWCWRRLLRVPWTARRSNQSMLKQISPGCSLVGLMLKLKLQYLWPPDVKSWLTGKDPDAGKDWGEEEKGTTEDEMVWWHLWLSGHGFGYTPGVGDGQGGLVCCSSWCRRESDMTERLNWNKKSHSFSAFTRRPKIL